MPQDLQKAVRGASERAEVRDAVRQLYARVQQLINLRRPVCLLSGRCCRFEEFGHRLYVTTVELAAFYHDATMARPALKWDGAGCPFQRNKLCTVHAIRPFGCRIFFCDASSTAWQNELYERFHSELKSLHDQLDVPYFYVEWRQALELLGLLPEYR